MIEKPSWTSSTLSQMAVASLMAFLCANLLALGYGLWFKVKEVVEISIPNLKWCVEVFGVAYFVRMMPQKQNGDKKEPEKPSV